jgi:hypothetical protein
MSYFEECLATGLWLTPEQRQALYKYLLSEKSELYKESALLLLTRGSFSTQIANAEILYSINQSRVSFECRRIGGADFSQEIRNIELGRSLNRNIKKLTQFFSQCEVDAISNFPVPGKIPQDVKGINISKFPFYDLDYYSDGKGKFLGLIRKWKAADKEILTKLRTL